MKKYLCLLVIAALLVCGLCGCGLAANDNDNSNNANDTSNTGDTIVYATEISLPAAATMTVGDTMTLNVSYSPSDTTEKNVTWTSSDATVVAVNASTGMLTAVKKGTATITATVQGENETLTDSCEVTVKEANGTSIAPADQTGAFSITTEDGTYEQDGNVYTLTAAGEYVLSGYLSGEIVVDAADAEVVLLLNGVTIEYDRNSPILVKNADEVSVKSAEGTENTIYDKRSTKTVDVDEQGEGAISAKCDLKIVGKGTLYVEGNYNNGIHTTKDLTVQKLTLKVKAYNNALKGKDSVTIKSGTLQVISTNGDGIETSDSDVSSKGNQRGTITIGETNATETPTVTVYAAGDGVQAAYNFEMNAGTLTVYNGSYSSYTAKNTTVDSYKGIKVKNELNVNGGTIVIHSYDDGLHADYGTALENG